ncbi:MAG: 50S ribosomal protein L10 [Magnetococcales bacterium]|nr:50S ribosomal protein L10 [Magnetococcales bacterium]
MDRAQKREFVKTLKSDLSGARTVVVAHYRGLNVPQMETLRGASRTEEATVRVVKNRLAKLAFEGTDFTSLNDLMTGPTALTYSADAVAAAKVAHEFAKNNDDFVILGGALGDKALSVDEVKALATMPSLDELRAKMVGLLQAPATRIATYSQEPASMLARVLQARGQQAA